MMKELMDCKTYPNWCFGQFEDNLNSTTPFQCVKSKYNHFGVKFIHSLLSYFCNSCTYSKHRVALCTLTVLKLRHDQVLGGRFYLSPLIEVSSWADPEGETGKSQVIWVTTPLLWIRAWSSDDQLMFIAAVKKGVIPVAHVYALHREIPPFPAGRVRGPCADAGIFFRGYSGPSDIKKL